MQMHTVYSLGRQPTHAAPLAGSGRPRLQLRAIHRPLAPLHQGVRCNSPPGAGACQPRAARQGAAPSSLRGAVALRADRGNSSVPGRPSLHPCGLGRAYSLPALLRVPSVLEVRPALSLLLFLFLPAPTHVSAASSVMTTKRKDRRSPLERAPEEEYEQNNWQEGKDQLPCGGRGTFSGNRDPEGARSGD
jgi:hypothetical protein